MVSHLIQGKNQAEERLRGGNQSNSGNHMNWVSNSDNRGAAGHRESHAEGDSVGDDDRQDYSFGGDVWNGVKNGAKFLGNTALDVGKTVAPLALRAGVKYFTGLSEGGQPQSRKSGGDIAWHHAQGEQPGKPIGQTYGQNQVSQATPSTSTIEQQNAMRHGGSTKRGR